MPYHATVYRTFIASPSDVAIERDIIRNVISEWNATHSFSDKIVFDPVGWETHSFPSLTGHPQSVINNQVLKDADILIGAFWTRIGTQTGSFASGTVEEIERMRDQGKPVMVYFSDAPAPPSSIDQAQYAQLKEFRQALYSKGLVESYSTHEEFHRKLQRQFAQHINSAGYKNIPPIPMAEFEEQEPRLSSDALELLRHASEGRGHILVLPGGVGYQLSGGQIDMSSPREHARWNKAFEELASAEMIRDHSGRGIEFKVTSHGFQYVDEKKIS